MLKRLRRPMQRTADLGEERLDVVVFERQPAAEHDIEDNPATPDVDLGPRIESAADDLRRGVVRAAAARLQEVAVLDLIREAEVGDLDVEVVVEENVLGLEVAVDDLEAVGVLDAGDELLEETPRLRLGHAAVGDDVVEELAAGVLEHDDDVCRRRDDLVPDRVLDEIYGMQG